MLESLLKESKPMLFRRKETVLDSSDQNHIFYLKQGHIRLYTVSKDGSELTLHIFSPASIFPIMWNKIPESDQYYFESLTPVEVYGFEKTRLLQLIAQKPGAYEEILQQLSSFSQSTIKKLEFKIFGNVYQQVIAILLDLASYFGRHDKNGTVITYWFTHQDIASLIGVSREKVTIEINNLLKRKLISYTNHFISIPKLQLLRSEIE